MELIPVVENPRRRRRRYSAKQRAYGFGGGRRRTRKRSTGRRRRNPSLAALSNPRRSYRRRSYRRRNPRGMGGLLGMFDFPAAGWTTGGMVVTRALPGMVANWFPAIPTAGPMGIVTKAAVVALMGWAAKQFIGARQAQHMTNGGLALIGLDLFDQYLAPKLGMGVSGFVSADELRQVTGGGMDGFVPAPTVVDGLGQLDPMSA